MKRLGLDRVWWLVTPGNPLKDRAELLPLEERKALARQLVSDPRIVVTDFEKELGSPFTAATLAHLRLRCPRVRFVWLMGADSLASFHRWRQWRQIFQAMPIAVIDRPGWHLNAVSSVAGRTYSRQRRPEAKAMGLAVSTPPAWCMLTGPLLKLSSTEIRAKERLRRQAPQSQDRGSAVPPETGPGLAT